MNNQKRVLDSSKLVSILSTIENTSSSNDKIRYLNDYYRRLNGNQKNILRVFMNYVYSPFIIFGIKTIPEKLLKRQPKIFLFPITNIDEAMSRIATAFLKDKLRGNSAKQELYNIIKACDSNTAKLVIKIIDRDLKIGMTSNSINKSIGGCLPIADYMGAVPFTGMGNIKKNIDKMTNGVIPWDNFFLAQEKADGLFAFIQADEINKAGINSGAIMSRKLKPIGAMFHELKKEIKTFKNEFDYTNLTFHGEFTIEGMDRLTSNGVFKALTTLEAKKEDDVSKDIIKKHITDLEEIFECSLSELQSRIRYSIWDITNSDLVQISNGGRFQLIVDTFNRMEVKDIKLKHIQLIEHQFFDTTELDLIVLYFKQLLKLNKEGIILKFTDGVFKAGKHNHCIKFKNEFSSDYKIVGFERGTGKYKNTLGSVYVESSDRMVRSKVPGFSDDLKDEIWNNQEKYLGKIIEVRANDYSISEDNIDEDGNQLYSLMHPRFVEIRQDKTEANTLAEVLKERDAFKIIDEMLGEIVPSTPKNYHCDFCKAVFPETKAKKDMNTKYLACPNCHNEGIRETTKEISGHYK